MKHQLVFHFSGVYFNGQEVAPGFVNILKTLMLYQ